MLNTPECIPLPLLLPVGTSVEDKQLYYLDDAREAAVIVSQLLPYPSVWLHAKHGVEAQQRGAILLTSIPMCDERVDPSGVG